MLDVYDEEEDRSQFSETDKDDYKDEKIIFLNLAQNFHNIKSFALV